MSGDGRLNVLLWYWGRRGGGAQFALGLARALRARPDIALDASLSSFVELREALAEAVPHAGFVPTYRGALELAATPWRLPLAARDVLRRARSADVVLCTMPHLWQPPVLAALAAIGVPFVPFIHDAEPHPGDSPLVWSWQHLGVLRRARTVVTLSEHVARALRLRAPGANVVALSLPALLTAPVPPVGPADDTGPRLLFFGRLLPYKGLDLLRDAFGILRLRHPEVRLHVAGMGDLDACAPGLRQVPGVTVEQRWIAESEIPSLLAAADLVVLPYREASQSGVIPQALACGVPVVATPVGGLREQIPPEAGLMAERPDAEALAEALTTALVPDRLAALRRAARRCAERDGWAPFVDRLVPILAEAARDERDRLLR